MTNPILPLKQYYCQKVLPAVYDESLSYYELLCKITAKINEIINMDISQNEAIDALNNYFHNLDVQTEIDNKLDHMKTAGDLGEAIAQFLNTINIYGYLTKSDLIASTTLKAGLYVKTLGNETYKDGKGHYYYTRNKTNDDHPDGDNLIELINVPVPQGSPAIVAEKIPEGHLNDILTDITTLQTNLTSLTNKYNNEIGALTNLNTTDKSTIVSAINETFNTATTATNTSTTVNSNLGNIANLNTSNKQNAVAAINEINLKNIAISQGGTGATTADGARQNLGVMTSHILYSSETGTSGDINFDDRLSELSLSLNDFKYLEFYYSNDKTGSDDDGLLMQRTYNWNSGTNYFDSDICLNMEGSTTIDNTTYYKFQHTQYEIGTPTDEDKAIKKTVDGKTASITFEVSGGNYSYGIITGADIKVYRVVGYL